MSAIRTRRRIRTACAALATTCAVASAPTASLAEADSHRGLRLVLQVTVDGLRGDLLERYRARFGPGGFQRLLEQGTVYTNAHYQHANTETIVGHATLATGAVPSLHGMVGNVWFDREAGELAYNIEDPDSPILPTREDASEGAQVDPAQKRSRTKGRSPRALLATTLADELVNHTAGRAKAFGVSGKDRSAVAMAGHAGKAFWYSTDTGDFVTARHYYAAYPEWAAQWNGERKALAFGGRVWSLLRPASDYLLADRDDRPYEIDLKGYGRVFPHAFGATDHPLFFTRVLVSPEGDRLTLDFAKALIAGEGLGQDDVPDYLSISFSSVDAVNHFFGPSSLENEDVVLQLDRTLADLFAFVDEHIGLERTLVVLSADHGMAEMPEQMAEWGLDVGRLYPEDVLARANEIAKKRFGIDEVAQFFFRPSLYLDSEAIASAGADPAHVERVVASALTGMDGIAIAVSRRELSARTDDDLLRRIRLNSHPSRSGDIYVAQKPYWFLSEKGPVAAMHGSPWRYDSFVPIVFLGPGVPARRVARTVHPADVAPTLANRLGIKPPSSSVGTPLGEVLP